MRSLFTILASHPPSYLILSITTRWLPSSAFLSWCLPHRLRSKEWGIPVQKSMPFVEFANVFLCCIADICQHLSIWTCLYTQWKLSTDLQQPWISQLNLSICIFRTASLLVRFGTAAVISLNLNSICWFLDRTSRTSTCKIVSCGWCASFYNRWYATKSSMCRLVQIVADENCCVFVVGIGITIMNHAWWWLGSVYRSAGVLYWI